MTTTEQMLSAMLQENTGRHFLDSGGAYGRHWERNQGRDFETEPEARLEFEVGQWSCVNVTLNVYHFLKSALDYDEQADGWFQAFSDLCWIVGDPTWDHAREWDDLWTPARRIGLDALRWIRANVGPRPRYRGYCGPPWSHRESVGAFFDYLRHLGFKVAGIYGDGDPVSVNTYNSEDLLSQTIQFEYAEVEGESEDLPFGDNAYVFLQIHGGCDVRGGYTAPRLFTASEELRIFDNARASIHCTHCNAYWYSDDGCHWYADGCCGSGAGKQLEDYDLIPACNDHNGRVTCGRPTNGAKVDPLFVDDDSQGYCPRCGHRLTASPF